MTQEIIPSEQIEGRTLAKMPESRLSEQEMFVRDVLKDYVYEKKITKVIDGEVVEEIEKISANPEDIIKQIFDEANNIVVQNNNGDIIPDYKARAQMKLKLLESMGIIKPKQVEVKVNFLSVLFGKK